MSIVVLFVFPAPGELDRLLPALGQVPEEVVIEKLSAVV
jgi:hypothetical protein